MKVKTKDFNNFYVFFNPIGESVEEGKEEEPHRGPEEEYLCWVCY